MMKLKQLRYFVSLSRTHSFEQTARLTGISQQALRTQIRHLEGEVGADLLFRGTGSVRLSHVGTALIDHANRVLAHAGNFDELAAAIRAGSGTSLRIGIAGSTVYSGLVETLVQFGKLEPDVDVSISQQPIRDLLKSLGTYELDLAFLRTEVHHPGFDTTVLGDEALWVALPQGHELDSGGPIALGDLAGEPFVGFVGPFNRTVHDYVAEACLTAGFVPAVETRTDDIQSLLGLVASHMGVSLVTEGVAKAVEMDGVRYRPISPPTPRSKHCVLSHPDEPPTSPARRFVELARSVSGTDDPLQAGNQGGRRGAP
jgi:DNA-binding transcriptional LysR family regulator